MPPGDGILFPIHLPATAAGAPDDYKGLPLRLTERAPPSVTPVDGVIGLVCVGMSNGSQECEAYRTQLAGSFGAEVNPAVRVANCAVGGHAVERWIDPAFDGTLWERCIEQVLPAAGIRVDQVRVIHHKAANQFTVGPGGAPLPLYPHPESDFQVFRENLSSFASRVRDWFPGVVAVYTSSRSYGGFAGSQNRGEPLSYEEGHALNLWLAENPEVDGVWYGWSAYLWAPACDTGVVNGLGICYERSDYVADGVHPSQEGRLKIAEIMHRRWMEEPWYRR